MHIFVAEAQKLTVIDYLVPFCFKIFSIIELLEKVGNWCGCIPTGNHAVENFCEIRGGDGFIISVYVIKKIERFVLIEFGDTIFKSVCVFFWALISDRGD